MLIHLILVVSLLNSSGIANITSVIDQTRNLVRFQHIYDSSNIENWVDPKLILDQEEGSKYLTEIKKTSQLSSTDILKSISVFIYDYLDPERGTPTSNDFSQPVEVWQDITAANTKVWCSHFAYSFGLFANYFNIPTRIIHMRTPAIEGVEMHVVAESYLQELDKWVVVDLTHNAFLVISQKTGEPLSAFETLEAYINTTPIYFYSHEGFVSLETELGQQIFADQSMYFKPGTKLIYESPIHEFGTMYLKD